jgi:cytochrome c-type protein NapB
MNKRKIAMTILFPILVGITANPVMAAEMVDSLRGGGLAESSDAPPVQNYQRDRAPIPRDYVQQPPLVPHKIDGYRIDAKSNKCLTCHSWANYRESGATKISQTHFSDREGNDLSNISARRYFCTQCHVPQVDSKPLVENTFEPVRVLKQAK